jgi:TonB family protein
MQQAPRQPPDSPSPQPSSSYRPNPAENGIYHVADGVTAPTVVYTVEPQFSEAARKRKVSARVIVEFVVETDGHVRDPRAVKSYGNPHENKKDQYAIQSLEPKAVDAVRGYRFKPATLRGELVPCRMTAEVNFEIF